MTDNSSTEYQTARRSQRLPLQIPIQVECFIRNQNCFAATATVTVMVNAHGALVRLPWALPLDQELQLQNLTTEEKQSARVAYIEVVVDGKFDVGVEFTCPNPKFWRVSFPPEDWSPSHPYAKENL